MWTSALFGLKNIEFIEVFGVSERTRRERGRASVDILRTRGRGSIFYDFVQTSFMDGPLLMFFIA